MKKSRSHLARKSKSGKPTYVPLPEPIELAHLAAILRPNAPSATDALKIALKWYFDAVLFVREQAASQIQALFEQKRKEEKRAEGRKHLKRLAPLGEAARWADTVRLDEAWNLLAHPEKLAARLGQIPKEGEQLLPAHKRERLLHELPKFSPKVKTSRTLMDNLLLGLQYFRAELRVKGDDSAGPDSKKSSTLRELLCFCSHAFCGLGTSVARKPNVITSVARAANKLRKSRQPKPDKIDYRVFAESQAVLSSVTVESVDRSRVFFP